MKTAPPDVLNDLYIAAHSQGYTDEDADLLRRAHDEIWCLREDRREARQAISEAQSVKPKWYTKELEDILGILADTLNVPRYNADALLAKARADVKCARRMQDLAQEVLDFGDAALERHRPRYEVAKQDLYALLTQGYPGSGDPAASNAASPLTEHFHGISMEADFETDMWTFRMESPYRVGVGRYRITHVSSSCSSQGENDGR